MLCVQNADYPGVDLGTNSVVVTPDTVTLTTPLSGSTTVVTKANPETTGDYGAKAKAAVTVNATDGMHNTTLFNGSVTENVNVTLNVCASSASAPGEFAPTGNVQIAATASASNAAASLEGSPGNLSDKYPVILRSIGSDYTQPVTSDIAFTDQKADTLNLGSFTVAYTKGVVTVG